MRRRLLALWAAALLCPLAGCGSAPELSAGPPVSQTPAAPQEQTDPTQSAPPSPVPEVSPGPPPEPEISAQPAPVLEDGDFVRVRDYIPDVQVCLPYAGAENFTGQVIYDFTDAWLRYGTVKKLAAAAERLAKEGWTLLIWDAFRPTWAQFKLWEACPDPNFVADPTRGFSSHSRGNTVDLTLALPDGTQAEMPSGFDEFSSLAGRDYSDVPEPAAAHARLLEDVMTACGFQGYSGEWWHFRDTDSYPVEEEFTPPAS